MISIRVRSRHPVFFPAVVALLLVTLGAPLQAALPVAVDGQRLPSLAPMLERTTAAVVNIATRGKARRRVELPLPRDPLFRRFFEVPSIERVQETASLGSGVIVDAENGLILTNFHVIKDAYEINVTLNDGRELRAEIIGRDPDTDVAVIQVSGESLTDIPIADSSELRVRIGVSTSMKSSKRSWKACSRSFRRLKTGPSCWMTRAAAS